MTHPNGLPSTWHEVKSERGEVLYWRRQHSGYEVHPCGGRYEAVVDWIGHAQIVIGLYDTLTHAIVACRDHMHANYNVPQPTQELSRS